MKYETYTDEKGFVRFQSNDQIPFADYLEKNHSELNSRQIEAHKQRRNDEVVAFIQKRREDDHKFRAENPELAAELDAERAFELRAAFGPGEEVVNVITGKITRT